MVSQGAAVLYGDWKETFSSFLSTKKVFLFLPVIFQTMWTVYLVMDQF